MENATDPPRGWHALVGVLEHDTTVFGHMARKDEVTGRCYNRDCRRWCEIDFTHLAATGHGRLPVDTIKRLLRCQRFDGCHLDFSVKPGPGLALRALKGFQHAAIRFRCVGCKFEHTASPEAVMARLHATGGEAAKCYTVEGLAAVTKAPCPKCKKAEWQINVLWPDTSTIGWRVAQDKKAR